MKVKLILLFLIGTFGIITAILLINNIQYIDEKDIYIYSIMFLSIALWGAILLYIYREYITKQEISKEKNLVQNILNITPNITFVTDFTNIIYANKAFLHFFNTASIESFNQEHSNILELLLPWDDYLHLKDGQSIDEFIQIIINTDMLKRKFMIFDKTFNLTAFNVSISKINYDKQKLYLLTFSNITQQEIEKKQIEHKAYYDGLTNIYNRNKFNELFEIELRKARRYGTPYCIAIIDIDNFKLFNDTYGHLIGDEVLISLATEVNAHIRDTDTFARWGGEEFMLLLSDTTLDIAIIIANKLREKISSLEHKVAGNITASFGLTQYKKHDTLEIMFKRCDDALYQAKKTGRDKVEAI